MNHPTRHDQLPPKPLRSLGTAEVPVDATLRGTTEIHATPSHDGVLAIRPRSHACRPIPSYDTPCHRIPIEILITILRLVTPSRTREDVYALLGLTHVCRLWRTSLIQYPRAWATIFATPDDCRSFVETCLERSQPLPLEVTVDIAKNRLDHTGCGCDEDESGTFLPNEETPCEWHFVFEPFAHPRNSKRIRVLDMDSSDTLLSDAPDFGSFQFPNPPFPQLTTLKWRNDGTEYADHILHSLPKLHTVAFEGRWGHSLALVNNLSSFAIKEYGWPLDAEVFRLFVSKNRSLESLELSAEIEGSTKGPPVDLLNLKFLSVDRCHGAAPTIFRVPAFRHLSSLQISLSSSSLHSFHAGGNGITLSAGFWVNDVADVWLQLTGYARPTLHHVCVYDRYSAPPHPYSWSSTTVTALMADVSSLDIGLNYSIWWGDNFWSELKRLGPCLKTVRFEVPEEEIGPSYGWGNPGFHPDRRLFDNIADLVEHRFKEGRPFSAVERMVVSEDEQADRLQDDVWRRFYDTRGIQKYLASVTTADTLQA